jgi:predicted DNA-binding transcriptional regulator YafY
VSALPLSIPARNSKREASRIKPTSPAGPAANSRLIALHQRLAAGEPLHAIQLSRELGLSSRTIKRDIERLRDFHGAPIVWNAASRSYRYSAPFDLLTGLRLDTDEILAIVLAGQTFAAWGATPLGRTLANAFGKIADFAGQAVSLPASDLRDVLFQPGQTDSLADSENKRFATLLEHILARRELTLAYQKLTADQPESRTVRPLHLAYLDHRWMLVGEDPSRTGWRNFVLSRIQSIAATGKTFTPPPTEAIKVHLTGSLGRFTGETEIEVRLRFSATAAPYAKERPWHDSQKLSPLPDGGAEVTLTLNNLIDVQRRILANGRHVEVLSPAELRQTVADEIAALTRTYALEIAASKKTT